MLRVRRSGLQAFVILFAATSAAAGQEPQPAETHYPAHSIYLEAGGVPAFDYGPYSLNVEQRLLPRTFLRVGAFVGPVDELMTVMLPIMMNFVTPGRQHNLELGAGIRWDVAGATSDEVRLAATIGYRYQELPGSAQVRAGLNFDLHSLNGGSDAWTFGPWPSLSIGFGF